MNASMILKSAIVCFTLSTSALASTYGSVEPIATSAVIDTGLSKRSVLTFVRHLPSGSCSAASSTR